MRIPFSCVIAILLVRISFVYAGPQDSISEIYLKWHLALDNHPELGEPFYFKTEGVPSDLAEAVRRIHKVGLGMVYFLCEKIANGPSASTMSLYRDVLLLDRIGGVNLWVSEFPTENVGEDITRIVATFQREWRQGVYEAPEERIRQLCRELQFKDGNQEISARDLVPIRRYGIFGLGEIVRQIKDKNSNHAFAAFLIITRQQEYADFIRYPQSRYLNSEDKIKKVQNWYNDNIEKVNSDSRGTMRKIGIALASH